LHHAHRKQFMKDPITIAFVKASDRHGGSVDGRLEIFEAQVEGQGEGHAAGSEGSFLAELRDCHPEFATHIVKCVNTYAAVFKVAKAENGDGPITNALREILRP
jgi:hypothetical protein